MSATNETGAERANSMDATAVYSDIIEPIFSILYATFIVKLKRSTQEDLKGPYFQFAIVTGLSIILNVCMNLIIRLFDIRLKIFQNRGTFMNILSYLSHVFATSITFGKILSVTVRFTSVWCPLKFKHFWSPYRTRIYMGLQFFSPFVFYCFMPFVQAAFAPTSDGYGHYLSVTAFWLKIAKTISVASYILFFVAAGPMCIATVYKLVQERKKIAIAQVGAWTASGSTSAIRHERVLAGCSVALAFAHALKAAQQSFESTSSFFVLSHQLERPKWTRVANFSFDLTTLYFMQFLDLRHLQILWFIAIILDDAKFQATMISYYLIANSITSFIEPVLLLVSSKILRKEIFGFCVQKIKAKLQSISTGN